MAKFISDFNNRFAVEAQSAESAFVPLDTANDRDTLVAVRHERTSDNCGCFSFQNFMFQIESEKPLAKKKIQFLFSHKIGFMALYDKNYYPVSCLRLEKKQEDHPYP